MINPFFRPKYRIVQVQSSYELKFRVDKIWRLFWLIPLCWDTCIGEDVNEKPMPKYFNSKENAIDYIGCKLTKYEFELSKIDQTIETVIYKSK